MVGACIEIGGDMMLIIEKYIKLLKNVLACAEEEKRIILDNGMSQWSVELIEDVVIPEMSELLAYANNGVVYFKYGEKQRVLESTYLMTDSMNDLYHTLLGKQISNLQTLYYSM